MKKKTKKKQTKSKPILTANTNLFIHDDTEVGV